jgi:ArsR family metal-binding transcriptional regulator
MVLLGDEAQVKAHFGPLEIVPILTQDRCTVCDECTIGSVRTHPMELLGDVGHLESCFGLFEDRVSVRAR